MIIREKRQIMKNDGLLNLVLWKVGLDEEKDAEAY